MVFYEQEIDVMIDAEKLQSKVRELGAQIARDYAGRELTLVGVLKGSIFFLTDLARAIDLPVRIELMGVSSYLDGNETTGEVRITHDVTTPMGGRHLLLVEDIVEFFPDDEIAQITPGIRDESCFVFTAQRANVLD